MKEITLDEVKKNLTHYIGKGTKLQFSNKDEWYYFDNFSADGISLFCKKEDGSWANRKINNITKIYNTEPIIIKKSIMEEKQYDPKELEAGEKIEREHKPTYEKIKAYYKEHGKMPPEDDVYKWISENHLEEFKKYYTLGLIPMEKKLKKEMGELKEHTIVNDKYIDSIKDNFKPPMLREEEPTMDVDKEVTPEPEIADLEKKEMVISTRQTVEGLIADIESALLDQESLAQLPPKANTILRLSNVLTDLKALRNDLDSYSKIVQESQKKEGKLISRVKDEEEEGVETQEKDDDNTNDKSKEILLGYKKADVQTILETNYKVINKDDQNWKISVRNNLRENSDSLLAVSLNVFFDDNCLDVTPNYFTEETEKIANRIYEEITEDLKAIKSNKSIIK